MREMFSSNKELCVNRKLDKMQVSDASSLLFLVASAVSIFFTPGLSVTLNHILNHI